MSEKLTPLALIVSVGIGMFGLCFWGFQHCLACDTAIRLETKAVAADLAQAKVQAQKEHAEMMDRVIGRMDTQFKEMFQRITRVEAKIEALK